LNEEIEEEVDLSSQLEEVALPLNYTFSSDLTEWAIVTKQFFQDSFDHRG
jgi:hypothetical protein